MRERERERDRDFRWREREIGRDCVSDGRTGLDETHSHKQQGPFTDTEIHTHTLTHRQLRC